MRCGREGEAAPGGGSQEGALPWLVPSDAGSTGGITGDAGSGQGPLRGWEVAGRRV